MLPHGDVGIGGPLIDTPVRHWTQGSTNFSPTNQPTKDGATATSGREGLQPV
jgi:hypothetical protein